MNPFEQELSSLSEQQAWVLQVLAKHRSALLRTLEDTLERARAGYVATCLESLRERGLAESSDQVWRLTWTGTGVANWREQKVWSDLLPAGMSLPEPRAGENGLEVGPPCQEYRATLFAPGRCWCGRAREEHLSVEARPDGEIGGSGQGEVKSGSLTEG